MMLLSRLYVHNRASVFFRGTSLEHCPLCLFASPFDQLAGQRSKASLLAKNHFVLLVFLAQSQKVSTYSSSALALPQMAPRVSKACKAKAKKSSSGRDHPVPPLDQELKIRRVRLPAKDYDHFTDFNEYLVSTVESQPQDLMLLVLNSVTLESSDCLSLNCSGPRRQQALPDILFSCM